MAKIIVALSGGVDSAIAALLLKEAGWEPIGVHLRLFDAEADDPSAEGVCCGDLAAADARMVAAELGIPFYVRDLRDAFAREVAATTVDAYARGETPNPCLACNHRVRIPGLLKLAAGLGVPAVATGHYVRKVERDGRIFLAEGVDPRRDQSYALYRLDQAALERLEFPLGAFSKDEARATAAAAGLSVADKPSSVDLCFAKSAGGVGKLVARERPDAGRPGALVDERGEVVGQHPGIAFVTIGQREGLQWRKTTPERRYIATIDPESGVATVAPRDRIATRAASLADPVYHDPAAAPLEARLRYQGPRFPARLEGDRVTFPELAAPLAPGQAVVLYSGERVVGGGTAAEVERGG